MKNLFLYILILLVLFSFVGCKKKKASKEMIERTNLILKQQELLNIKYPDKQYQKHGVGDELFNNLDEYLIYNPNDNDITIDFDKLLKSQHPLADYLNFWITEHKNNHKDIVPGTDEWNIWMMQSPLADKESDTEYNQRLKSNPLSVRGSVFSYLIDEKGKYIKEPKYTIRVIEQRCPFCIYKDKEFINTQEVREAESLSDLHIFNTSGISYWPDAKRKYKKTAYLNSNQPQEKAEPEDNILYYFENINKEVQDNRLIAKEKYNGKQLKIKAQVARIYEDKVELLYGPYVFLPKEDLRKLHAGQYITFVATMKFIDYSSGNSSSSAFEQWARDMDDALRDLDKAIGDLDSGAMGYSFENAKLEKIEEGELPVFY